MSTDAPLQLLIVEDHSDLLELLAACAESRGMEVACAASVAAAGEAIERQVFDVVLVDLGLGADSGFDVVRGLRESSPDTQVVVMSATTSFSSALTSFELAAFAFVPKPFDVDHLLDTVERAAEHRRISLNNRRLLWELQTIADISDGIAHSLNVSEVVTGALERMCRALQVANAAIRVKDPATGAFDLAGVIGSTAVRQVWTANGGPIPRPSDTVIATGEPVVIEDLAPLFGDARLDLPVRSAVSVPMIVRDELIGTLSVTYGEPRRFSAADRRLLMTIGSQVGASVQSARLHEVVSRGKREWEQTFDAIADPIGVYDAAGSLLRGNAALAEQLGCDLRDLRGRSCAEVGLCGGRCVQCAVDSPVLGPTREEVTRPDGQIFSVTTFPIVGSEAAVVQVAKNVTPEIVNARRLQALSEELAAANRRSMAALVQLRNTQAALLQAEKLSAIGQLVAGVAHELNNPLTSVIGYAQLLEEEIASGGGGLDRAALGHDLHRIAEESERAARIVRNLLAFARRQSAARTLHDASDLAARTLALREYALNSSGVEVVKELPAGLPPVMVDGNQLQQALLNLILNAEQALRGQALRRLSLSVRFDRDAAAVAVSLADTGHGIDPANLGRIFDPFFTTREVGEGTGLGLSICYGIVRDHGGQIVVDSRPGDGTVFTILLPAALTDGAAAESVLVVHSGEGQHDMVPRALEAWGYAVSVEHTSRGGLERYRSGAFNRLFLESRLVAPDLGSWRAARATETRRSPLVLLGAAEDADVESFGREQASAVLALPFQLRSLRSAVRISIQEFA